MPRTHLEPAVRASPCCPPPPLQERPKPLFCSPTPSSLHSWGHLVLSGRQGLRNVHCEVWQGGYVIGPGPQVSPWSSAFPRKSRAASSQPPLAVPHWQLPAFSGQMHSQSDRPQGASLLPAPRSSYPIGNQCQTSRHSFFLFGVPPLPHFLVPLTGAYLLQILDLVSLQLL